MHIAEVVLAASGSSGDQGEWAPFLGDGFFAWMVLAFGAAMVVGNVLALVRPSKEGEQAPLGRAVAMIAVGAVAAVWGIASLVS